MAQNPQHRVAEYVLSHHPPHNPDTFVLVPGSAVISIIAIISLMTVLLSLIVVVACLSGTVFPMEAKSGREARAGVGCLWDCQVFYIERLFPVNRVAIFTRPFPRLLGDRELTLPDLH
ncbi:hypothetical protein J6590_028113 [Homalodisca vitripennis]|nr:hypothetical protein J6590_028113 [Homalodisca vitripennis]